MLFKFEIEVLIVEIWFKRDLGGEGCLLLELVLIIWFNYEIFVFKLDEVFLLMILFRDLIEVVLFLI